MSGPGGPPMLSQLLGMAGGQAARPPGTIPPNQPAPRSDASRRILAARQAGVTPDQITQQPGYRPPGTAAPPQARGAAPSPQAQPQPPAATGATGPSIPLPRPRPEGAPTGGPSPADFMKQALAMEAAKRNIPTTVVAPTSAAPVDPADFIRQAQAMAARQQQVPTPTVREATPDEITSAQKNEMAKSIASQRSGGGQPAAPAAQGTVTPPVPSLAPSPAQAPPPVGVQPREDMKRTIQHDKKGGFKYPTSTESGRGKSEAYGPSLNYYRVLGVEAGDNVGAARAYEKLRAREKSDPSSITMEEDKLLSSSGKIPAYNRSMEPAAVKKRFDERGTPEPEAGGSTVKKADPAEAVAQKTIDQAGTPPRMKFPTQEDVNKNPGAYKTREPPSDQVETDTKIKETEGED